jgi:hypothetical protein
LPLMGRQNSAQCFRKSEGAPKFRRSAGNERIPKQRLGCGVVDELLVEVVTTAAGSLRDPGCWAAAEPSMMPLCSFFCSYND